MARKEALHSPGVTCHSDSKRTVLKTETLETKSLYGDNVADTGAGYTCDQFGFLLDRQLGNKCLSLDESLFPPTDSSDVCCGIQSVREVRVVSGNAGSNLRDG